MVLRVFVKSVLKISFRRHYDLLNIFNRLFVVIIAFYLPQALEQEGRYHMGDVTGGKVVSKTIKTVYSNMQLFKWFCGVWFL